MQSELCLLFFGQCLLYHHHVLGICGSDQLNTDMQNFQLISKPPVPHTTFSHLHQVILCVKSDKSWLDDEIAHAEAILNGLHWDHKGLHTFITEHDAFLMPVCRLPSEILTRTFTLSLLEYETSGLNSQWAPLLLTQVCKGWCEAALSTQNLWSFVTLTSMRCQNASLAKIWPSQTMSSPLTVCLDSEDHPHSKMKHLCCVIAVLVQFFDCWKDLDIVLLRPNCK